MKEGMKYGRRERRKGGRSTKDEVKEGRKERKNEAKMKHDSKEHLSKDH